MSIYRKHNSNFVHGGPQRWRAPQSKNSSTWIWQPTVPAWEKEFISSVGCISWKEFLEKKKYTETCDNINQWDDVACKEAFENAKEQFRAKINNLPCDIALPDPNMYLNENNWDIEPNPDLIFDLEREQNISDIELEEEKGPKLIRFEDLLDPSVQDSSDGWSSVEDAPNTGGKSVCVEDATWQWKGGSSNENMRASRCQNIWNNPSQWNHEGMIKNDSDVMLEAGSSWDKPQYIRFRNNNHQGNHGWRK